MIINGESVILRATYDTKIMDPLLIGNELERYFHINIHQRTEIPILYVSSKSSIGNRIHRIRLSDEKITREHFLNTLKIRQRCQWCYFAKDGPNITYVSMDNSNSIERYENNDQKFISIYLPSPSGIIIRNQNIWVVNNSQLIILVPRLLFNKKVTYLIFNQIDLASFYNLPITVPLFFSDYSTFRPFHLDVDNYGRVYVIGALLNFGYENDRNNPQLYILTNGEQEIPSIVCAGPWGMFGVNVYHSKLKLRMLTSANDFYFYLYSSP
jgi:hypothetical protein